MYAESDDGARMAVGVMIRRDREPLWHWTREDLLLVNGPSHEYRGKMEDREKEES